MEHLLFSLVGLLMLVALAIFVYVGLRLLYAGAMLIPLRTWRQVEAEVERAEVVNDSETLVHVRVHYRFTLDGRGGQPQHYARSIVPHEPFFMLKRDTKAQVAAIRAVGKISIWYAEELPELQYASRPHAAWQATKGVAVIAMGLLCIAFPLLMVKPAWFGIGE